MRSGAPAMMARKPSAASSAVSTSCPAPTRCTRNRSRNVRSSSMTTILANYPSRTPGEPAYHDSLGADGQSSNYAHRPTPSARSQLMRVRGGELGVNGEHALAELDQVRIAHAVLDQSAHRLEQVFGGCSELAARAHQGLDHRFERQLASVVGVRAVDEKGYRPQRFPARVDLRPARYVGAEHHFAPPQQAQLVRRGVSAAAVRQPRPAAPARARARPRFGRPLPPRGGPRPPSPAGRAAAPRVAGPPGPR